MVPLASDAAVLRRTVVRRARAALRIVRVAQLDARLLALQEAPRDAQPERELPVLGAQRPRHREGQHADEGRLARLVARVEVLCVQRLAVGHPDVGRAWKGGSNAAKRQLGRNLGGLWLKSHRFLRWSEVPGPSSRVRRAAPRLQIQSEETMVARCGTAKTAT